MTAHPPTQIADLIRGGPIYLAVDDDGNEIVTFTGNMDIDADGANGQLGGRAVYAPDDNGLDYLANAKTSEGRWCGVLTDEHGEPFVQGPDDPNPGAYISSTTYQVPGSQQNSVWAQLDFNSIPAIVVPPVIIEKTQGIVMGCLCSVKYKDKLVWGMVGDGGPTSKDGEASCELARRLGVNPNPRDGGIDERAVEYTIYVGKTFTFNGYTFQLQHSNGVHAPLATPNSVTLYPNGPKN